MTTPLAKDFDVYDLTADRVVDGPWPPRAETPAAVVADPDALAPAKKKGGRPKGSKSKKAKTAKAPKAPKTEAPVEPVTEIKTPDPLRLVAPGGQWLSNMRRITADQWVWILIPVAAIGLALSLAFLTGALKP